MKKIIFSLFAVSFLAFQTQAQKELTEGYIKMEITEVSSDDEQTAMMLQMMKGTQTEVYFRGSKYATFMNMMGGMFNMETHINEEEKSFDMLMDAMGQKFWVNSDLEEARSTEQSKAVEKAKVTYDKNDSKKILGYNTYKVRIQLPDSEDTQIEGYITEDIKTKANLMQGMESLQLAGFALEFTVKTPIMTMKMETKEIKDIVDSGKLELKTEGYQKMTLDEFTKQMGGMGGMGF